MALQARLDIQQDLSRRISHMSRHGPMSRVLRLERNRKAVVAQRFFRCALFPTPIFSSQRWVDSRFPVQVKMSYVLPFNLHHTNSCLSLLIPFYEGHESEPVH